MILNLNFSNKNKVMIKRSFILSLISVAALSVDIEDASVVEDETTLAQVKANADAFTVLDIK